ncbi:hypothetical protein PHLGIDRAFT_232441 [Phlebiopsis gigantea 11061_1 CR5-6]|uniref:NmrA-like domain-containing protein n=1 Tax=Phlebiopsis gigantea (strain 11061_1 CR5-6) TaxID=745531 RepID=A0A0C3SC14_PHLG1|nr:hypothetical protein PHLGIDRAFT_232441 [Phlebiopsis gigantea 11061_1 CR5-6]
MSAQKTPVFFLGATGYLGGSVLARLLEHPAASSYEITALVRSQEKAKKLEPFGVKTAIGTIQDLDLLEKLASEAHIVFSIINADDDPHIQAILRGLKKRHATGDLPILIHTSGTGVFLSHANGLHGDAVVFDDNKPEQFEALPHEALHRSVDELVIAADKEGYAKTYIILPSTIFGTPSNALTKAGIQNTHSIQLPFLIKASIGRGQGGVVGKGAAKWNYVSNADTAELFVAVFNGVTTPNNTVPHGREGLFIGENGVFAWSEVGNAIAKALYEAGKGKSPEATTFTSEELTKYFGSEFVGNLIAGSNCIGLATRSKALGWTPKNTKEDLIASVKVEVDAILKEQASQ